MPPLGFQVPGLAASRPTPTRRLLAFTSRDAVNGKEHVRLDAGIGVEVHNEAGLIVADRVDVAIHVERLAGRNRDRPTQPEQRVLGREAVIHHDQRGVVSDVAPDASSHGEIAGLRGEHRLVADPQLPVQLHLRLHVQPVHCDSRIIRGGGLPEKQTDTERLDLIGSVAGELTITLEVRPGLVVCSLIEELRLCGNGHAVERDSGTVGDTPNQGIKEVQVKSLNDSHESRHNDLLWLRTCLLVSRR